MNPELRKKLVTNLTMGSIVGSMIPWGLIFGLYLHYYRDLVVVFVLGEAPFYIPVYNDVLKILSGGLLTNDKILIAYGPHIVALLAFFVLCILRALIEPYTFRNELFKENTLFFVKFIASHVVFLTFWAFALGARAMELSCGAIWPFTGLVDAPESGMLFWFLTVGLLADMSYRGLFEDYPRFDAAKIYQRPSGSQTRDPLAVDPNQPPPGTQFYRLPQDSNAYDRVIGLNEAKQTMQEALNMMLDTEEGKRMKEYGLAPPRGIMLYGPPGTGKTSFARASAQVLGIPFLVVNASSITGSLVGSTERNINAIFDFAARNAPCVVFWDEIDAVGKKRTGDDNNSPSQLALNVLLARMDGFARQTNVILIAATNRLDILDDALIRPGRFDCHIYVGLPDVPARKEIIKLYCRNRPVDISDSEYEELARLTEGMSPAELEALVASAAKMAYYDDSLIRKEHFTRQLKRPGSTIEGRNTY